jgi:hypothetical protein
MAKCGNVWRSKSERVTQYKSTYTDLLLAGCVTIVKNVDLLARFGELEPLADLHLLLNRIILQPFDALLFLHVFPQKLLVLLLVCSNLMSPGKQGWNSAWSFQYYESIDDASQNHDRVNSF